MKLSRLNTRVANFALVLGLACLQLAFPANAGKTNIAVAANFARTAVALAEAFRARTGHDAVLTVGSTGKLFAQIVNGAPFDVFLAADKATPAKLVSLGKAVEGTQNTYATGRLVLWGPRTNSDAGSPGEALSATSFRHLAIANPGLAPYGRAAREFLQSLGLWDAVAGRVVMGQSVGQAHSMVATGNAEFGLIAQSYVMEEMNAGAQGVWPISARLYNPIEQDAVLLVQGAQNPAARSFAEFLSSTEAAKIITAAGYGAGGQQ